MQIARTLLIIGIWTALLPYLGFPLFVKNILFVLTGLTVIYVSLLVYKRSKDPSTDDTKNKSFDNFSEGGPEAIIFEENLIQVDDQDEEN